MCSLQGEIGTREINPSRNISSQGDTLEVRKEKKPGLSFWNGK